jgi:predicted transcriptional regulator
LCRLLGNPVAFAIVQLLNKTRDLTPSEIARSVGRSVPRVSNVLGALRLAEVVRYDTDGNAIATG